MSRVQLITADWVLPVSSPPIQDGAVVIEGKRISFVGKRSDVEGVAGIAAADRISLGPAALLPGLINVHAHLELTLFRGFLEDLPFRDWILKLTKTKYERLSELDLRASSLLGACEAIRAGITTIADTGDSPAPFDALIEAGIRGIAYREVFGPDPAEADSSLESLKVKIDQMRSRETDLVSVGVSPHAPYTVSGQLFRKVASFALDQSLDLCVHAAESAAERELLTNGTGPFAEGLRARGIEWQAPGVSTVRYLESLGLLSTSPLLVHCVTADRDDVTLAAARNARIAHCPKSNAKLGHGIASLAEMLRAGARVGLGTDSVASNNRLDLLDEARFCCLMQRGSSADYAKPSAREIINLMTMGGAHALNMGEQIGSLDAGKQADITAVSLISTSLVPVHDVEAAIVFAAASCDVILTMVAGEVLFDGTEVKTVDESRLRASAIESVKKLS